MTDDCLKCAATCEKCDGPASVRGREPLIDPRPGIRKHAAEVRMRILRRLLDNEKWERLVALAEERAFSEGARVYGNASYYKSDAELEHEGDCEISDLIFYEHIPVERSHR